MLFGNRTATVKVRNKATGETATVFAGQLVLGAARTIPRRGTRDLLRAYSASPVLQAVVRKIATSMAAVQWVAKVRTPEGTEIPAPGHIAERLINGGVPGLDGIQCRIFEQQCIELVGEAFGIIDRNRMGAPAVRWPIPPHWVMNVPQPTGNVFEVQPPGGASLMFTREDVLWHKDVDPHDPYQRGVGIGRSLSDELNADEAAAKHTGASLENRARPDIIISGSKELPLAKEDAVRLNEVWGQRFGGPENQGKPFFSAAPISVEQLTPSFRELQLTKLREFERDIIVTVFGVPPEIMGILANSNRATIDAAELLFAKFVLVPRLDARKAVYNEQLAWQYDERLLIDYVDPVEENREFKLQVISSRPAAFDDDEVRGLAGEQPLPVDEDGAGGSTGAADVQATALNGAQIAALQAIVTQVASGGVPADTAVQMILVAFPTIDAATAEAIVNPAAASAGMAPAPGDVSADGAEKAVRKDITADQIAEILASIENDLMFSLMKSQTTSSVAEFGGDALSDVGVNIEFDMDAPRVVDFISENAGSQSQLINGTTQKQLRATLSEGVAAREGQVDLIRRVQSVVEDATAARADMIARTETTRAAGFASEEAIGQAGFTEKEWMAVQDDRTRDTHREMDGQPAPVGVPFLSPSGDSAMYPGDFSTAGENANCRCVVVTAESLSDKTLRVAAWQAKAAQMGRVEATYARQLRSVFREQGQQAIEAIERLP